jgi:hypothetical protein
MIDLSPIVIDLKELIKAPSLISVQAPIVTGPSENSLQLAKTALESIVTLSAFIETFDILTLSAIFILPASRLQLTTDSHLKPAGSP